MKNKQHLLNLLDAYDKAASEERRTIEQDLFASYSAERAVLVLDMSGFSTTTDRHGIVYFLSLIRKMNRMAEPVIEKFDGTVVKFEADDVFAVFANCKNAIDAALALNMAYDAVNMISDSGEEIHIKVGIDFGTIILIDDNEILQGWDLYGDAVNRASKLGEDLAERSEILVTEEAFATLSEGHGYDAEEVKFSIFGVTIDARQIRH